MEDHPLVGIWRLVSMRRFDLAGNGADAEVITGMLVYTVQGWMSEALEYRMPGDDKAAYVFYSGLYEIKDDQTLTHMPRIHTNRQLEQTEQPRRYEMDGDRFTLIAENPNGSAHLVWERVAL